MEQSDIDELLAFVLASGDAPETRKHIAHLLLSHRVQTTERCARIVERQAIHSVGDAFAKVAPIYTISEMNSILREVAEEIRLSGWK